MKKNIILPQGIKVDESWTLFLDRDGVINKRLVDDYVKSIDEFIILPEVLSAIKRFSNCFGRVVIITNQQGVAKGLMSRNDVEKVHEYLRQEVVAVGGKIDAIYYCPDWASAVPNCRKPSPSMALQAQSDFPEIDFSKTIMVGDMPSDIAFGHNLGMTTIWVDEGKGRVVLEDLRPDFVVKSLATLYF